MTSGNLPQPERPQTFLDIMREHAVRAILAEEDRRFLEYVNQPIPQSVVEFAAIPDLPNGAVKYSVTVDQQPVPMGEALAEVHMAACPIHGEQPHIGGYNQGGWDSMAVCLKCCAAIYAAWLSKNVTPEQKAESR